jgi:hypothetical protein
MNKKDKIEARKAIFDMHKVILFTKVEHSRPELGISTGLTFKVNNYHFEKKLVFPVQLAADLENNYEMENSDSVETLSIYYGYHW